MKGRKLLLILLTLVVTLGMFSEVFAASQMISVKRSIKYDQFADIYLGKGGVYFSPSVYNGSVTVTRIDPDQSHNSKSFKFYPRWLDVSLILNGSTSEVNKANGLVYVYFNLNQQTLNAWNENELDIFHFNESTKKWESCEVVRYVKTKNLPYGRLSCVIEKFGLYGMGVKR